jgi:hypothetical protein
MSPEPVGVTSAAVLCEFPTLHSLRICLSEQDGREALERVTPVLLFAGCAPNKRCSHYRYMSLLIIAQLFVLRAIDSFKRVREARQQSRLFAR